MINYFVKFDDLKLTSLQLFSYEESGESRVELKNLADVKDSLIPGSSLFVMLPSALFGFYSTDNDLGLKDEILKANILSESEDGLISDISDSVEITSPFCNGKKLILAVLPRYFSI